VAEVVAGSLKHFDGERYRLVAWCLMPNHVHAVVQPLAGNELPEILHSWKSFSSKEANRLLGRSGQFWQPEYYDHLIRDEQDFGRQVEYVLTNPQRAGLENWKWMGSGTDVGGTAVSAVKEHGQDAHATSAALPSIAQVMRSGGFDCVIANPPYIRIQTMQEFSPIEAEYLKGRYSTAVSGNFDIYVCFVEKGFSVLGRGGRLGFILPSKFFQTDYGQALRELLVSKRAVESIVDFSHFRYSTGQPLTHASCSSRFQKTPTSDTLRLKMGPGCWRYPATLPRSRSQSSPPVLGSSQGDGNEPFLTRLKAAQFGSSTSPPKSRVDQVLGPMKSSL